MIITTPMNSQPSLHSHVQDHTPTVRDLDYTDMFTILTALKLRTHIPNKWQMNAFVCLKWCYVDGSAKANERWRMPSFAFGSIPSDVGKLSKCHRMFVWRQ